MITLKNINLSSIDLSGIDLRGIKLGLGGRGGGSGDGFPVLPGDVTRWHFGGLTNEMMAAMDDPRIEDADGKGRFLSFKNFAWGGMSGVNGYVQDFNDFRNNATVDKIRIDEQGSNSIKVTILTTGIGNAIYIPKNIYQFNKSYSIKISSEGYNEGDLSLSFYALSTSTATTVKVPLNPNGITEIPAIKEDDFLAVYINVSGKVGSFTVEQLPLYPGALVFDGVDDYGVCDNFPILTKEKGYTVVALRKWLTPETKTINEVLLGNFRNNPIWIGANLGAFQFEVKYNGSKKVQTASFGIENNITLNNNHLFSYQISNSYNGSILRLGSKVGGNFFTVGCGGDQFYANAAIWELVFLDHDATEEELTKIKDYFVKTYPWLFPDQAWTVVGKTNEDEDRATIANITGNGNNLVLSNFGFAEGSGYGLYAENYAGGRWVQSTDRADLTWTSYSVNITSVKVASTQLYYQSYPEQPSFIVPSYKIKVYGLKDGQTLSYRQATSEGQQLYKISEDGTYTLPSFPFKANGDWYGFTLNKVQESCDITIEQIPEYEGYLVTDGVDDKAVSKQFKFGENFTVILDFKFPVKKISYCGFDLSSKVRIQNIQGSGVYVVLKGNKTLIPSNVVRAVTSEGKVYDENWNEYNIVPGNISSNYTMVNLGFDGSKQFAESATKLAGIYSSTLSKDDCIKAYNYLQTLKAK